MLRKNQKPVFFSDQQIRLLTQADDSLRELCRDMRETLRIVKRVLVLSPRLCSDSIESLVRMAERVGSLVEFRQRTVTAARNNSLRIELHFGTLPDSRDDLGGSEELQQKEMPQEDPRRNLPGEEEIDRLLERAFQIELIASKLHPQPAHFRKLFSGFSTL